MKKKVVLMPVFVALFAAVICVGCFMRIPLGVVPIVLQNALSILVAVILGGVWGGLPALLFFVAGVIGLPVFSGGTGGLSVVLGPTGGFIWGYVIGAFAAGLIAGKPAVGEKGKLISWSTLRVVLAIVAGMVILYIPGIIHFSRWALGAGKVPADKSVLAYTMGACVIPYLPGDLLKILVAIPVAVKVRPVVAQYLYGGAAAESVAGEDGAGIAEGESVIAKDDASAAEAESGAE